MLVKGFMSKTLQRGSSNFEISTSNKESKNYLLDNFYLGNSLYFDNTKTGAVKDSIVFEKSRHCF
jgi:hypothetical protein